MKRRSLVLTLRPVSLTGSGAKAGDLWRKPLWCQRFSRQVTPAALQASVAKDLGLPPSTELLTFVENAPTTADDSPGGSQSAPIVNKEAPSSFEDLCTEINEFLATGADGLHGTWDISEDSSLAQVQVRL
jgi:hypothetical protein